MSKHTVGKTKGARAGRAMADSIVRLLRVMQRDRSALHVLDGMIRELLEARKEFEG